MWESIYKCFWLSIRQCQVIGLVTFKFGKNGTKKSLRRKISNVLLLLSCYGNCIGALYYLTNQNHGMATMSATLYIWIFQTNLHVSIITMYSLSKENTHMRMLAEMVDLETMMTQKGFRINDKSIIRQCRWICAYKALLFIVSLQIRSMSANEGTNNYSIIVVAAYFVVPIVTNYFTTILIASYVLYIRKRFRILNRRLELCVNHQNRINVIGKIGFQKGFVRICMLHHNLTKIIDTFNETFGLIFLTTFAYCFVTIVSGVYSSISFIRNGNISGIKGSVAIILMFVECAVSLCYYCESAEDEVT